LTRLIKTLLNHGVLFFATINKTTSYNWTAPKGPTVIGTIQGAFRKNHFEASVINNTKTDNMRHKNTSAFTESERHKNTSATTIIAVDNTSISKVKGEIVWTTQRRYSDRARKMMRTDSIPADKIDVVSLLYKDNMERSFFKSYGDKILFMATSIRRLSDHKPLKMTKCISNCTHMCRKLKLKLDKAEKTVTFTAPV
jgi:hypothetical protein